MVSIPARIVCTCMPVLHEDALIQPECSLSTSLSRRSQSPGSGYTYNQTVALLRSTSSHIYHRKLDIADITFHIMISSRLTKRVRTPPLQRNARRKIEHRYLTTTSVAERIGDGTGSLTLLDLPEELLLLIISQLHALRLDKTQSEAFKNKEKETDRQYENHYRRIALHSLCLTSRRLNRLAVPVLYSAFTGSTTRYGT